MDIEAKDKYIADHLIKLQPDTLRFMVADLTAEVERLTSLCANYREALTAVQRFEGVIYGAGGIGAIDLLNKALEADKALQAEKEGE